MRILVSTTKPCIGRLKQFGAWHGYMCAAKYAMHGERVAVKDRARLRVLSLVTSPDELRVNPSLEEPESLDHLIRMARGKLCRDEGVPLV